MIDKTNSGLEKYKVAVKDMRSVTEIALSKTTSSWQDFVSASKAAGFDFVQFLSSNMASAIQSFSENLGQMFVGAGDEFRSGLEKALSIVVDFAKALGSLLISIGTALEFIPGFGQAAGTPYIISGAALVAAASGAGALISASADKRRKNAQGMATGGIIPSGFPNDSYPAMLSSGETVIPSPRPLPNMGGAQTIENHLYIDGREVQIALSNRSYKQSR